MPPEFFGQEIKVTTSGDIKVPVSFLIADREYIITEIIQEWQDYGFGPTASGRKNRWWQRRHRNYYHVKTSSGELFEIYYDRGTSPNHPELKKWILHKRL
jgi:hypothetical protein